MTNPRSLGIAAFLGAALVLCGCMRSHRVADVEYSGFLHDYTRLERGGRNEAMYRWVKPGVDWTRYDKCMLDPVEMWRAKSGSRDLSDREAQELTNYLYVALHRALSDYVTMVDQPQRGAVRYEVAITSVNRRNVVLDTVSTVTPVGLAASTMGQAFTGRASFTGDAAMEFRILDSKSGEVLAEGIDRRAGGRWLGKELSDWADVYAAMDAWANLVGYRTCVELQRGNCRAPVNQ